MTHEHTVSCSHHACQTPGEKTFPVILAQALPAYIEMLAERSFFREEKITILWLCHAHCSHRVDGESEEKTLVGIILHELFRGTSCFLHVSRRKGPKDSLYLHSIIL